MRYLLLTENPYEDSLVCSAHDMWFPRSLPVRGYYNDYGSIESYDESSPAVKAVELALETDLVEVGTGDNRVHDIPTERGMRFDQILEAVWERRIQVLRDTDRLSRKSTVDDTLLHKNIPTLQRLRKMLPELGFNLGNGDGQLIIDEKGQGWCRIREGGYGKGSETLTNVLEKLKSHYAVAITAGSGSYNWNSELQVMPLPAEDNFSFLSRESKKPLYVYQMMILSDVWGVVKNFGNYKKYRNDIQKEWKSALEIQKHDADDIAKSDPELAEMLRSYQMNTWSRIPFTVGPSHHLSYAAKAHHEHPFTQQQIDDFLEDAAVFRCLERLIPQIRYWWKPSFSCGPQCAEYEMYCDWFEALCLISEKRNREDSCA